MMEISDVVKEVLAAETLKDFRALVEKHRGFMVNVFERQALDAHKTYLATKECREKTKLDVSAYAACILSRLKRKIDGD